MLWLKNIFAKILNIAKFKRSYKSKTTYFNAHETLTMHSKVNEKTETLQGQIKELVKNGCKSPELFITRFKNEQVRVYEAKTINFVLKLTGKEEGLIIPQSEIEGFFLNLVFEFFINGRFSVLFSKTPIFIMQRASAELSFLIYSYYKLCAFKEGVAGFDACSQSRLNKTLSKKKINVSKISMDELIMLEEASAKDKQALDFALNLTNEIIGVKLENIKQSGGIKV